MKVLVFGADGFIGRNVCDELESGHDVVRASRDGKLGDKNIQVDLLDQNSIYDALKNTRPEVIINCAGVVGSNLDTDLNVKFTKNILDQTVKVGGVKRVIISGSAGEYGIVKQSDIPVDENTPLNANLGYGLSKLKEEQTALEYQKRYKIGVVVLRIFNPIGRGMADKFLLTRLLRQVEEYRLGKRDNIELSRLDSERDYIPVEDVASAFRVVVEGNPRENVYNVGSGRSTTNGRLLALILQNSKLNSNPQIRETSNEVEPLVATCADITRISNEFGWHPVKKIEESVKEIIYG